MAQPRDDKRDVILRAATAVFSEKGFAGSNLDEVVAAAAVSKQTLYKHFSDKAALYREIVLDIGNQVDSSFLDLPDPVSVEHVEKWIETLALRTVRTMMDPEVQRIRRLVIAEALRFPEVAEDYWRSGFARVLATLSAHFSGLASEGKLRVPVPSLAAEHFVGLLLWIPSNRTMFSGKPDTVSDKELRRYAREGARAFLRAYRADSDPSHPGNMLRS